MILTRSERRQMERAKERHVKNMKKAGYSKFKDVTSDPHTKEIMSRQKNKPEKVYLNGLFVVQVYPFNCSWGDVKRVMIRYNDARPLHDWNMLQRIKNDIFGKEATALEVYPKESEKQDVANVYWLFVLPENFECPIEAPRGTKNV